MRVTLVAILAAWLPGAVQAEEAHDLFERARSLARKGAYEEALELFTRAADLSQNDAIHLARGRVLFRLGRCREASAAYEQAQSAPAADEAKRDELVAQLSQYRKDLSTCAGVLDVDCPLGASVSLDGGDPRPCPVRSLTVASGAHELFVTGPDIELRRVVHVTAMEEARVKLTPAKTEQPEPSPAAPAVVSPAPAVVSPAPAVVAPVSPDPVSPAAPVPGHRHLLEWSLSAAGAGLLIGALVLDAAVIPSAIDEFRATPTLDAHDRAASWQLAGGAAYGAALIVGGCALAAWLIE